MEQNSKVEEKPKEEPKRTFTEAEIAQIKRNDTLVTIAHYLLIAVIIGLLTFVWMNVGSIDGVKCVRQPCDFCMERFEYIECKELGNFEVNDPFVNIPKGD